MPINDNFVFSDAVPANQAISMADIVQRGEASRRRMLDNTLNAVSAAQIARENAMANQALQQAQLMQQDKALAQRDAESIRNAKLLEDDIKLRRQYDLDRVAAADRAVSDRELKQKRDTQFSTLADIISTDPPPPSEWNFQLDRIGSDLDPDSKTRINTAWKIRRDQMNREYMMAENASKQANDAIEANPAKLKEYRDLMLQKYGQLVGFDPSSSKFYPLKQKPRDDHPGDLGGDGRIVPIAEILKNRQSQISQPKQEGPGFMRNAVGYIGDILNAIRAPVPRMFENNPAVKYGMGYLPTMYGNPLSAAWRLLENSGQSTNAPVQVPIPQPER